MANRRFGWRNGAVICRSITIAENVTVGDGDDTVAVAGNQKGYIEVTIDGSTRYIPTYDDVSSS